MSVLRSRLRGRGLADIAAANEQTLIQTGAITKTEASVPLTSVQLKAQTPATNTASSITGTTMTAGAQAPSSRNVEVVIPEAHAYVRWAAIRSGALAFSAVTTKAISAPADKVTAFRLARTRATRLGARGTAVSPYPDLVRRWWAAVDPNGQAAWERTVVTYATARTHPQSVPAATRWPKGIAEAVTAAFLAAHKRDPKTADVAVVTSFRPSNLNVLVGLQDPPLYASSAGTLKVIPSANQTIPIPTTGYKPIPEVKDDRIAVPSYDAVNENVALDTPEVLADPGAPPDPPPGEGETLWVPTDTAGAATGTGGFPWLLAGGAVLALLLLSK
jgi:hypothetical protein